MCQNNTPSQKPLSGGWAKVQGHATAQLQLSNQSPVMCQLGISVMRTSIRHEREYDTDRSYATGPHIVGRQRAANALECKIADWFNCYVLLDCHQDTGANQDLPRLGFIAKPRCNVGHGANRGIIKSTFKA